MQIQTNKPAITEVPTLYLIDGHSVIYRYHLAFKDNPLKTTDGVIVNGVFGMAKIIATLRINYPMTHLAVIFDPPYRTWRKDYYPEYKANRTHVDDISPQLEMAYSLIKTWGIYTNAFRPLEADDVIGILAKQAAEQGLQVRIASKDKDFAQLVTDKIKLIDLGQSVGKDEATIIDREGVKHKWGVYPKQIVDYLSLLGDTSDNVPGVSGVGKKGAADLLTAHGTIEGIYQALATFPKGRKASLEAAKDILLRNRKLITLATQYEIPVTIDDLKVGPLHTATLFELLERFEFFSVIKILTRA